VSVTIKVRVAGSNDFREVELPQGTEIRDIRVESLGMQVNIEPYDKGWRDGRVHTSVFLNELPYENTPDVGMTIGDIHVNPDEPEDRTWVFRADAMLYAHDKSIVAKNKTLNAKYKEYIIAPKPWTNPYAPSEDASQGKRSE
jgi:hypothetical protein